MTRDHSPAVSDRIEINAPVHRVWDLLICQDRMRKWSPETFAQLFIPRRIKRNTFSLNLNRRKNFFWPTVSVYVEVTANRRLSFYVFGPAATWTYELDDLGGTTQLTLRRDLRNERPSWVTIIVAGLALGGARNHDSELIAGMRTTLEGIRADLER